MRGTDKLAQALMPADAKKAITASLLLSLTALILVVGFMMGQASGSRNAN